MDKLELAVLNRCINYTEDHGGCVRIKYCPGKSMTISCLEDAESIRSSLVFLVNAVLSQKKGQQEFTENMKKLLKKLRKKIKKDEKE